MIDPDAIEILKERPEWQELAAHVEQAVATLDRVSDIKLHDKDALAVETLARIRAIEVLKAVLEPFGFTIGKTPNKKRHAIKKHGLG